MPDHSSLDRFVSAQSSGVYERALGELRAGQKRTHWIWFVFPQIAGLARSATAQHYAIGSLAEAQAYLAHPVLGPRLIEAVRAMLDHPETSATAILGSPDDMKLRSCLTLFGKAAPDEPAFAKALEMFYDGDPDPLTMARLEADGGTRHDTD